jgi:hypothetical protein
MTPYEKLVERWVSGRMTIPAGVPEDELKEFETKYGVSLSLVPDFKEYLLNVNGMAQIGGQDCDEKGFAFWPLNRIKSVPQECAENNVEPPKIDDIKNYFAFADYMQWSWAYAIYLGPNQPGKILQFGIQCPRIIATSFAQLVESYLGDSKELYPAPPTRSK